LPYRFLPCYTPLVALSLRPECQGTVYDVTSRGNGRSKIPRSNKDRATLVTKFAAIIQKRTSQIHAYCLMDNPHHPVVEPLDDNLTTDLLW
jgi:hypothetical protein